MILPDDILARIREDFSAGETLEVIVRLEDLVRADPELFTVRILRCLLFQSKGKALDLEDAINLAKEDPRDLIVSAEYDGRFGARQRDLSMPFVQPAGGG